MGELIVFRPAAELTAEENLATFIRLARTELTAFGEDLDFDSDVWDITDWAVSKGFRDVRASRLRLLFGHGKSKKERTPLSAVIRDFAKAYIRYTSHGSKGSTSKINKQIRALQLLDLGLSDAGISNLVYCNAGVLDRAIALGSDLPEAQLEVCGFGLAAIARFLDTHGLVTAPLGTWVSPTYVSKSRAGDRVGIEFEKNKADKLPDPEVLDALPEAFRRAKDPRDVIVTSIAAILCSAPERINEVLVLAEDCIVERTEKDGRQSLGLRWRGSKGAPDHIKWIVPGMADVVREAIARLKRETAEARRIARWYEDNPARVYLPPELGHLRSKRFLTLFEVSDMMLVGTTRQNIMRWVKNAGLPEHYDYKGGRSKRVVAFEDLEQHILSLLPRGFPLYDTRTGLRCSEALLVVPYGYFRRKGPNLAKGSPCLFEPVDYHHISVGLGGKGRETGSISSFYRTGIDPERRLGVSTHQFRHYLNTLAHAGGLSQLDIAKWSGRADVSQNAAYDHMSSDDILDKLRSRVGDDRMAIGPIAEVPANLPVSRSEFAKLAVPTAHVTKYGFCIHDFAASPCEMFRKCLSCTEHLCIKGEEAKSARIREQLQMARLSLKRAQEAEAEDTYGAGDWVEIHTKTVERLVQLVAILDDDSVPVGTTIQLNKSGTLTLSAQAQRDRDLLDGRKGAELTASAASQTKEIAHG